MKANCLCTGFAVIALLLCVTHANASNPASSYLRASMTAMGGEARLRAISTIEYRAVGTRMMVEQSERPSGPYYIDHFEVSETRDLVHSRARIEQADQGYAADKWWLQQTQPSTGTIVLNDDVAASLSDGAYTFAGGYYVQDNQEQFAFAPERVLQTAMAAADLRALPDAILHGVRHHVLAFTWNRAPCVLMINAATNLPWSIRWTRAYPYQTFLNPWGDVTTTLTYNSWSLEPYGISYPREWTYERVGLPDTQLSIVELHINPPVDPAALTVPADIYAAHHQKLRPVNAVPLGFGGSGPPREIAPGILFYPGGWNVSFIKQQTGVVMLEAPWSDGYTQRAFDAAREHFGEPVTAVITTSDSWPHIAGIRQAVARGIPVYALDLNLPILTRLLRAPHHQIPDQLAMRPVAPRFRVVRGDTFVGSGPNRLEIVPYRSATGERQMMVYFPAHRLLYTSDLFSGDGDGGWFTPQYLHEMIGVVEREHLAVTTIFGMHYDPTPYNSVVNYVRRFVTSASATAPGEPADAVPAPLAAMSYLLGSWQCNGSFPSTGKPISSTMRFERDLSGKVILKHHDDLAPAGYHALEVWTFDPKEEHLVDTLTDNFGGTRSFTADGSVDNVLTWHSGPAVTPIQQFVYTRLNDSRMRVDWEVSKDALHFTVGDTLLCTK